MDQPREPAGSSKGGQFRSTPGMNGSDLPTLTANHGTSNPMSRLCENELADKMATCHVSVQPYGDGVRLSGDWSGMIVDVTPTPRNPDNTYGLHVTVMDDHGGLHAYKPLLSDDYRFHDDSIVLELELAHAMEAASFNPSRYPSQIPEVRETDRRIADDIYRYGAYRYDDTDGYRYMEKRLDVFSPMMVNHARTTYVEQQMNHVNGFIQLSEADQQSQASMFRERFDRTIKERRSELRDHAHLLADPNVTWDRQALVAAAYSGDPVLHDAALTNPRYPHGEDE